MTNETDKKQRFKALIAEGVTIDAAATQCVINDGEIQSVIDDVGLQDCREDTALEIHISNHFPEAVSVLVSMMRSEDPKLAFAAACKIIDTRLMVYKERNKKNIIKAVVRSIKDDDGWDFTAKK